MRSRALTVLILPALILALFWSFARADEPTETPLPMLPTETPLPMLPTETPLPMLPTETPLPMLPTVTPLPMLPTVTPPPMLPTVTPPPMLPTVTPPPMLPTVTPTMLPTETATMLPMETPTALPAEPPPAAVQPVESDGGGGGSDQRPPEQDAGSAENAEQAATPALPSAPVSMSSVPAEAEDVVMMEGRACLDENENDACEQDEPGVAGVSIVAENGEAMAITGENGEYVLRVRQAQPVVVVSPTGYALRGASKVLARPRADFVLGRVQAAAPTLTPTPTPTPRAFVQAVIEDVSQASVNAVGTTINLLPAYILIGLLVFAVLVSNSRLAAALNGMRREQRRAYEQSHAVELLRRRDQIRAEIAASGTHALIMQLSADALSESVISRKDGESENALLDLAATPTPYFKVADGAGRRFTFTMNPLLLKKSGLVDRRARVIPLADVGATAGVEAQALWESLSERASFNPRPVTPRDADWYMLVETPRSGGVFSGMPIWLGSLFQRGRRQAV